MWQALEQEAGVPLLRKTGGLDFGKGDAASLLAFRDNLRQAGIACEWLSPAEVELRFPQFRLDEDMMGLYQVDSGVLMASECVKTQARLAADTAQQFAPAHQSPESRFILIRSV